MVDKLFRCGFRIEADDEDHYTVFIVKGANREAATRTLKIEFIKFVRAVYPKLFPKEKIKEALNALQITELTFADNASMFEIENVNLVDLEE